MGVLACERLKEIIKEDENIAVKLKNFFTSPFTTKDAGKIPNLDICFSSNKCKVLWDIERSCSKIHLKEIHYWARGIHPSVLKGHTLELTELLWKDTFSHQKQRGFWIANILSFISALGYNPWDYTQVSILYTLVYMYICMSADLLIDNLKR